MSRTQPGTEGVVDGQAQVETNRVDHRAQPNAGNHFLGKGKGKGKGDPEQPPAGTTIHHDLEYVTDGHERQRLDLYLPRDLPKDGGLVPLIIRIHGGAFKFGSKEERVPFRYLLDGYAMASINYRLSWHALWPAQIEDCKAAVRWLRAHALQYGLDPERFVALGSSSGGHLAAMLGVNNTSKLFDVGDNLDYNSHVKAVVDFYGPTDFCQMDAHRLHGGMVHDNADSPESELIGGPIQELPDRVATANPATYVTSRSPPFLIIHGDRDLLVPYHQSVLLAEALKKADVPVRFYTVEGGGHGGFQDSKVNDVVDDFLAEHLHHTSRLDCNCVIV